MVQFLPKKKSHVLLKNGQTDAEITLQAHAQGIGTACRTALKFDQFLVELDRIVQRQGQTQGPNDDSS